MHEIWLDFDVVFIPENEELDEKSRKNRNKMKTKSYAVNRILNPYNIQGVAVGVTV